MALPLPNVVPDLRTQDNFDTLARQFPLSRKAMAIETPHAVGGSGEPAFANAWVNFGGTEQPARFWKDPMGIVHVQGLIKTGTIATKAFTLPAGYRPGADLMFGTVSNNAFGRITVLANGDVIPQVGSNANFSINCSFKQEA